MSRPGRVERTTRTLVGSPGGMVVGLGGPNLFASLAVDPAGRIVVATMPGALTVVTPDGHVAGRVEVPDEVLVTNLCFDPRDPGRAVVTLSSTGRVVDLRLPSR